MKPVLVSVKSIQRNKEGEELKMELVSEGKFYVKDGTQYIVYEESELTEMKGVTTVIKVLPGGSVLLLRLGKLRQRQEFSKGKVTRSQYDTPVGTFDVQMKTYECRATCSMDRYDSVGLRRPYRRRQCQLYTINHNRAGGSSVMEMKDLLKQGITEA